MSLKQPAEPRDRAARIRFGVVALAIAIALFVSLVVLKPAMPDRIQLLTGPVGSAYHELGLRYASELAKKGLTAKVVVTTGVSDNLERLAGGLEDAVAFAPTTLDTSFSAESDTYRLEALGNVAFEPLWLFFRADLEIQRIPDLTGRMLATGSPGTVSYHVARLLIDSNGLGDDVQIRALTVTSVGVLLDDIESGKIDALFVTGLPESSIVATLLAADSVSFLSFDRAAAYAARIQGIARVVIPAGVLDLSRDVPAEDAQLLTAFTGLVALDGLHPSVAPLLLQAASNLQDELTFLSTDTVLPGHDELSLPLSPSAKRYFEQGERGLSKFLPYNVTRFLNHLGFVVLPLLTLIVVLLKLVPLALRIYSSVQLVALFKRLSVVEQGSASGVERSVLLSELNRIDKKSARMFVPRSTVHDYIDFRQFLHDMRERLEQRGAAD